MKLLTKDFFLQDTVSVAKSLIGKELVYKNKDFEIGGIINETEAYTQEDPACHAFNGKITKRNKVMFEEAGTIYIYLIYGMYHCLNIVTEDKNRGCAVLIRSIIPTKIISTNREFWAKFMVKYELGITNPDNENEYLNGLATFASFLIFGFIPLTPYFFKGNQDDLFLYSIIATFFSLCLLGFLRAYLAKERLIPAVGEVLFVGVVSSSLAYLVGFLFKNIV